MTDDGLKSLPLEDLHKSAGARFGAFAGWSMPLTYPPGVLKEHLHTRQHAGLFDISHMKLFEIEGPDAGRLLETACPLDTSALSRGQSKYTLLLNADAGIIDDLIVTRLGDHRFMVVANAGNADKDGARLKALAAGLNAAVTPLDRVFLAIQGPDAADIVARSGIDAAGLTFMTGFEPQPGWFMTRSGYTGEDGFEIAVPLSDAADLAERLLADDRLMWIGLAARDSLRLEAGLCLHGNDITEETDPVEAALVWAIPKSLREGGRFEGASAFSAALDKGPAQRRVGLKPDGRQPVRGGATLTDEAGNPVGRVTSGGFGPSAGHPVAIGYVSTSLASAGTRIFADVRGTKVPVDVHSLPFTPHRYRKG
ncbi:MAG: glycine cleavage system aminomethyltransferase GcvT [Rhizobiaceae bacterium]|nr:glycine cleavage system aminomethyltransferase GcvT [Rhizobiaceae bacterium]